MTRRRRTVETPPRDVSIEGLLAFLRKHRGFDFDGYKRTSLMRRIDKRMTDVGVRGYGNYVDFLEVHPEEFLHLFNTILINVTAFFRDPGAWDCVRDEVIPRLLRLKGDSEPIRVWSAGCSSGEEAYSVAILLAEALGTDAFVRRVKVYATDIDEEALSQARIASYSARSVSSIPPQLLSKYFEQTGNRYSVQKELRRGVIFGRHDLLQDAPISRVDLLLCRNTIMYFGAEAQARILERLHFASNEGGVLFLGKAEMLLTQANLFAPFELKRRLFLRVPRNGRDRTVTSMVASLPHGEDGAAQLLDLQFAASVFDTSPIPQLVIDGAGVLTMANAAARTALKLDARDLGRRFYDLGISYRPVELRSKIEEALSRRRRVEVRDVEWPLQGETLVMDLTLTPRLNGASNSGVHIALVDVTRFRGLQQELRKSHQEIESAYEELQSTSEELETTNEELQSTVEELETTNEELQSTNEELETMNEELQSTNEELQTINTELRDRSDELRRVNRFFGSILTSLQAGVVVVDQELKVHVWNQCSQELWGLREEEVRGKHLLNLDIGLPVEKLKGPVRAVLADGKPTEQTFEATNRRGKAILCRVEFTSLHGEDDAPWGCILLMEPLDRTATVPAKKPAGDNKPGTNNKPAAKNNPGNNKKPASNNAKPARSTKRTAK